MSPWFYTYLVLNACSLIEAPSGASTLPATAQGACDASVIYAVYLLVRRQKRNCLRAKQRSTGCIRDHGIAVGACLCRLLRVVLSQMVAKPTVGIANLLRSCDELIPGHPHVFTEALSSINSYSNAFFALVSYVTYLTQSPVWV